MNARTGTILWNWKVAVRTAEEIILIIFGQRARTKEGRLQVELAQIEYDLPRLPTTLVAAFPATLEEVAEADLLVHVVDASSPSLPRQVEAVEQVLEEIGASGLPVVVALNKTDLLASDARLTLPGPSAALPAVRVSALAGSGIDELVRGISEQLVRRFAALDVLIPYERGDQVALLHQYGTLEYEGYEEGGTRLRGHIPANHSGPFAPFATRSAASKWKRLRA